MAQSDRASYLAMRDGSSPSANAKGGPFRVRWTARPHEIAIATRICRHRIPPFAIGAVCALTSPASEFGQNPPQLRGNPAQFYFARVLVVSLSEQLAAPAGPPAFHEDINTVTGQPHGNTPYADYSVYRWLRKAIRARLNQTGPDQVEAAIDAQLRVVRENGALRLSLD
jgi:hypothetical protein